MDSYHGKRTWLCIKCIRGDVIVVNIQRIISLSLKMLKEH